MRFDALALCGRQERCTVGKARIEHDYRTMLTFVQFLHKIRGDAKQIGLWRADQLFMLNT